MKRPVNGLRNTSKGESLISSLGMKSTSHWGCQLVSGRLNPSFNIYVCNRVQGLAALNICCMWQRAHCPTTSLCITFTPLIVTALDLRKAGIYLRHNFYDDSACPLIPGNNHVTCPLIPGNNHVTCPLIPGNNHVT